MDLKDMQIQTRNNVIREKKEEVNILEETMSDSSIKKWGFKEIPNTEDKWNGM